MKAAIVRNFGAPEELLIESVADPIPAPGQVIVELRAASLNWHDIVTRRTGRGLALPNLLGMDGAGVRRDTGEEVVIYPGLGWGDSQVGHQPNFAVVGDATDGTYAELIAVPEGSLFPKPPHLSWSEAAALPCAGLTAYRALFTRADLQPGETVLVLGAGSGVSTFAVAFAAAGGADVYVTSSSTEKIERMTSIGARGGVLYTSSDWPSAVTALTSGGVDVVISGVGSELSDALLCLRMGGRVVVFGSRAGKSASFDPSQLYFRQASVLGTTMGSPADFHKMLRFVCQHELHPVIDRTYPLDQIAQAHAYLESGLGQGKVAITIST